MIVLASSSPRRIELLKTLTLDFKIIKPVFDEKTISKSQRYYALTEAKNKAFSIKTLLNPNDFCISCDTIVVLKREILGKPKDENEAKIFLKKLSNNKHKVITGVCIIYKDKVITKEICSKVYFNKLTDEEIENYINNENVLDKAGAYAIQDDANFHLIKKIKGDYNNIVGFPLSYIEKQLIKYNLI